MKRIQTVLVSALGALVLAGCQSSPSPQDLVSSIASADADIVRLSVHAKPPGESGYEAVASTSAEKRNMPSDPEDLQAMASGEVVVRDEPGAIDVTVPMCMKDGKATAAAGVTLDAAIGREAAITKARDIAAQLEKGMK